MAKPFFYDDDFMWETLGIRGLPPRLFQYTSIDSLEKILQNKTLRFSRLDKVNDPEEAGAEDIENAATSVFVSCWTAAENESIPMWSMYGSQFQGIRLSMPSNMFLGRDKPSIFDKGGAKLIVGSDEHDPPEWQINRKPPAMRTSGCGLTGPNKVHYSNDPVFRKSRVIHQEAGGVRCYTFDLGMVKSEHWAYEEEWRFKISWFMDEVVWPDDHFFRSVTADLNSYPVLTEQLFLTLDESVLNEIIITKGPLMPERDEERLEKIMLQYATSAVIQESEIPLRSQPGKCAP